MTVHALETQFRWHWIVFMICETTGVVHCCKWLAFPPFFFTASVNFTCNWSQTCMMIRNLFRQIVTVFSFYLCISLIVDRRKGGEFTNMYVLMISYVCKTTVSVCVSPSPSVFIFIFNIPFFFMGFHIFGDLFWKCSYCHLVSHSLLKYFLLQLQQTCLLCSQRESLHFKPETFVPDVSHL